MTENETDTGYLITGPADPNVGDLVDIQVVKFGTRVQMSRELAIERGLVERTPEEQAEYDAWRAEQRELQVAAWRIYGEALHAFTLLRNPVARLVLELHSPSDGAWPRCQGCEFGGYEAEEPEWPCSTVQAIAGHFEIELPEAHLLMTKPKEATT